MQIDGHINGVCHGKRVEVDDRYRSVIVWETVTATVCHIQFAAMHHNLIGLVTHGTSVNYFHSVNVNTCHIAKTGIGVYLYRTGVTAYIGIAAVKGYVSAVGNGNLRNVFGCGRIHHLNEV